MIQIFVQELTKARREQVAAAKSGLAPTDANDGVIATASSAE
jgi:hypothetical protein